MMFKSSLILAFSCCCCIISLVNGAATPPATGAADILLLRQDPANKASIQLAEDGAAFLESIDEPVSLVTLFGSPKKHVEELMNYLVDRPLNTSNPSTFGLSMWPKINRHSIAGNVPGARLIALHVDNSTLVGDDYAAEAKVMAIAGILSSHMIMNTPFDQDDGLSPDLDVLLAKQVPIAALRFMLAMEKEWKNVGLETLENPSISRNNFYTNAHGTVCQTHHLTSYDADTIFYMQLASQRNGLTPVVHECEKMTDDVSSIHPKLKGSVYFTGPRIVSLAKQLVDLVNKRDFEDKLAVGAVESLLLHVNQVFTDHQALVKDGKLDAAKLLPSIKTYMDERLELVLRGFPKLQDQVKQSLHIGIAAAAKALKLPAE